MDVVHHKLAVLRSKLDGYKSLQEAEKKTKVPKEYLVLGTILLSAIVLVLSVGLGGLTALAGFVYPAYKSFQAIETKNKGDDTQWLVYWVIFAFFSIVETFVDYVLYMIPFYYAFKLAFLLWAMLPQTRGAMFLYDSFLRDFLKKNESRIDAAMADARKNAGTIASELAGATSEIAQNVVAGGGASEETKKDT